MNKTAKNILVICLNIVSMWLLIFAKSWNIAPRVHRDGTIVNPESLLYELSSNSNVNDWSIWSANKIPGGSALGVMLLIAFIIVVVLFILDTINKRPSKITDRMLSLCTLLPAIVLALLIILGDIRPIIIDARDHLKPFTLAYVGMILLIAAVVIANISTTKPSQSSISNDTIKANDEKSVSKGAINHKSKAGEDLVDQLRTYKTLLDEGIITEEEFNNKKKELLG